MPNDRVRPRVQIACGFPNIIRPFKTDIKPREPYNPTGLGIGLIRQKKIPNHEQLTKRTQAQKLSQNCPKCPEIIRRGLHRIKTVDWVKLAMENQERLKRECSENAMIRSERRGCFGESGYKVHQKHERKDRRTPSIIRGTSTDREETSCRSDTEDVAINRRTSNCVVSMETAGVRSEAEHRGIPDIMKPSKKDESPPPDKNWFSSYSAVLRSPGGPKGKKLSLPPIHDINSSTVCPHHLGSVRFRRYRFDRESAKNTGNKRGKGKQKKKRKTQREVELELEGWNYESDFESDSDSDSSTITNDGKPRKTKRRNKNAHAQTAEYSDNDVQIQNDRHRNNRLSGARDKPEVRIQQCLVRNPPWHGLRSYPSGVVDKERSEWNTVRSTNEKQVNVLRVSPAAPSTKRCQKPINLQMGKISPVPSWSRCKTPADDEVRSVSPVSSVSTTPYADLNWNSGSQMAPWASEAAGEVIARFIDEDDDAFLLSLTDKYRW